MRIHLIAIGGSVMHNLALALKKNGHIVSGSDDEIYEPSFSRLSKAGLLPTQFGWFPEGIDHSIDFIILGMHARKDNPELQKALKSGIKVYSFPEFIYQHAKRKKRVVVAGSHGKTSTTAMIMHVLNKNNLPFDFMVGAQIDGFETMVQLSEAPVMILEGDEYLSSPIDRTPKFLHYKPHIAVITGIAWDHINVFPTFEEYKQPFYQLIQTMEPGGELIYYESDPNLKEMIQAIPQNVQPIAYSALPHEVTEGEVRLMDSKGDRHPLVVFGEHNLENLHAAKLVCQQLGITENQFNEAITSFKGASKRLQKIKETSHFTAWIDFAHAPSKVKATVGAVRNLQPDRKMVACVELHTFSSLNKTFLPHYIGSMDSADIACVFYSQHTLEMKKLPPITPDETRIAFNRSDLKVFSDKTELEGFLKQQSWHDCNLLLMSSGNFGGMRIQQFIDELIQNELP